MNMVSKPKRPAWKAVWKKKEIAINLHSMNMKDTDIANVVKVSLDVVRKWLGTAPA